MNDIWNWQYWHNLPYLTCHLLGQWQHGFFTQQFSPQPPAEIAAVWGQEISVYRVQQVHGDRILTPSEIEQTELLPEQNYPPADGLISENANQSVWVASADCTPALIGDVVSGRVAAVHAGWRGTAKSIVPKTIVRFLQFGSVLENLRVAMGPAIAGEVYQVTESVAAEVGRSLFDLDPVNAEIKTNEDIISALKASDNSPLFDDPEPERIRLDVRCVNQLQLQQLGLKPEQIAIAPFCTFQQSDKFFSYRRTQEKKVQWSGIVSTE